VTTEAVRARLLSQGLKNVQGSRILSHLVIISAGNAQRLSAALSLPCYANPAALSTAAPVTGEGHCQKWSPLTFVFTAATAGEGIPAKHPPYSRAPLGSVFRAGIHAPYAVLQLSLLGAP